MEAPEELLRKIQHVKAPEGLQQRIIDQASALPSVARIQYLWALRACAAILVISIFSLTALFSESEKEYSIDSNAYSDIVNDSNQLYE